MKRSALALAISLVISFLIANAYAAFDGRHTNDLLHIWLLFLGFGPSPVSLLILSALVAWNYRSVPSVVKAMLFGAFLAVYPWPIELLVNPKGAHLSATGSGETGRRIFAGWRDAGAWLAIVASLGALGGVAFRVIAYGSRR